MVYRWQRAWPGKAQGRLAGQCGSARAHVLPQAPAGPLRETAGWEEGQEDPWRAYPETELEDWGRYGKQMPHCSKRVVTLSPPASVTVKTPSLSSRVPL